MMKIRFTLRIILSILAQKQGVHGGEILASGYLEELLTAEKNTNKSRTLSYLREEITIESS